MEDEKYSEIKVTVHSRLRKKLKLNDYAIRANQFARQASKMKPTKVITSIFRRDQLIKAVLKAIYRSIINDPPHSLMLDNTYYLNNSYVLHNTINVYLSAKRLYDYLDKTTKAKMTVNGNIKINRLTNAIRILIVAGVLRKIEFKNLNKVEKDYIGSIDEPFKVGSFYNVQLNWTNLGNWEKINQLKMTSKVFYTSDAIRAVFSDEVADNLNVIMGRPSTKIEELDIERMNSLADTIKEKGYITISEACKKAPELNLAFGKKDRKDHTLDDTNARTHLISFINLGWFKARGIRYDTASTAKVKDLKPMSKILYVYR